MNKMVVVAGSGVRGVRRAKGGLKRHLATSTALVGVALLATPAAAQVSGSSGGSGTVTNGGTAGGVQRSGTTNSGASINALVVNNTTGSPTDDAYSQLATAGQSAVLVNTGANNLTTTRSGGAALRLVASSGNVSWGISQNDTASTVDLAGSYGIYTTSGTGFINFVDVSSGAAGLRTITGNGTAVAGIYASAPGGINLQIGAPTISGFATGIDATSASAIGITTVGGSISGTTFGIRTSGGGAATLSLGGAVAGSTNSILTGAANDSLTLNSGATLSGTADLGAGINTLTLTGAGTTDTLNVGTLLNATNLVKSGTGNWTLTGTAGVSDFTGGVTINAGTLTVASAAALSNSSANRSIVNNAALVFAQTEASNNNSYSYALYSTVSGTGSVTVARDTLFVDRAQTYTGATTVTNGGLVGLFVPDAIASSSGVTISNTTTDRTSNVILYANQKIASLSSAGTGRNVVDFGGNYTLTLTNASGTFNGALVQDSGAVGTLVVQSGSQTLGGGASPFSGAALYSGGTTINSGATLTATTNLAIGTGAVVDNGLLAFNGASGTVANAVSGTGNVTVANVGSGNTLTFTGALTATGGVTVTGASNTAFNAGVAGGMLENGGGGRTLTIAGNATNATANTNGSGLYVQTGSGTTTVNVNPGATLATTAASGNRDGITALTPTAITNNGTIASSFNAGVALAGGGSLTSNGTITGGNGTNSYGVAVSNGAAATVTLQAASQVSGTQGGLAFQSTGTGANRATLSNAGQVTSTRYGVESSGAGETVVTNLSGGNIVGGQGGILAGANGALAVSNAGTIGTGSVSGSTFTVGGSGFAIAFATGAVTNTGTLNSTGASVYQTDTAGTLNLVNTGTIGGAGHVVDPDDTVVARGAATILNSGAITSPNFYAIDMLNGGTLANAASGVISAGVQDSNRFGVFVTGASATIDNYGTIKSTSADQSRGIQTDDHAAMINLYAGSTTGSIVTGAGNDTLALYNGQVNGTAVTRDYNDAVTGLMGGTVTLQNAGTLAAASFGSVNLGGGTDTLMLRGAGTGAQAGTMSIAGFLGTGAEVLTKADTGTWTLTGATPTAATITAGIGGMPSSGGLLIFNGTTGLTGNIVVNGGVIQSASSGAFGSGTIFAADPTIQYAATTTETNNLVLQTADPMGDPTRLQVGNGVTATLTGRISQGTAGQPNMGGQTIAATQPLIFEQIGGTGAGTFVLTNGLNDYNGLTTINAGTTVTERNVGTALGSGGVLINNGATVLIDNQTGGAFGLDAGTYSGTGTLAFTGNAGSITDIGFFSTTTTIGLGSGGLIDVRSGRVVGSSSNQGFWTNNQGDLAVASGATFQTSEGLVRVGKLTGAGTVQVDGAGSLTIGVGGIAATTATFTGSIADQGSAGALTKVGAGTQTLTGPITYTGGTTVSAGTLRFTDTLLPSGTVQIAKPGTLELNFTGGSRIQSNATIQGDGTLLKTGAGEYRNQSTIALSVGGLIDIQNGRFTGSNAELGRFTNNQGRLNIGANGFFDGVEGDIFVDGLTGTGRLGGGFGTRGSTTIGVANGTAIFDGAITNGQEGVLTLIKAGTGTQTLSAASSYTGSTTVSGGTLALTGGGTIASSSLLINNAIFDISGITAAGTSIVNLNGTTAGANVALGARNLTVTAAAGSYAGGVTGTGALTVIGQTPASTLTFGGALTNTGGLVATAASLTLNAGAAGGILENGAGDRTLTIAGGSATNATTNTNGSGLYVQTTSGTTTVRVNSGATLATTTTASGNRDGVTALTATAITNNGTISSSFNAGVALAGGGSVTSNGTITGGNGGNGYGIAVSSGAAAMVTLQAGGTVSGAQGGVAFQSTGAGANAAVLSNAGQITSTRYGIETTGGGNPSITNTATGRIVGGQAGIALSGTGTAKIANSGVVSGTGATSYGIDAAAGSGTITNNSGGFIVGATNGIRSAVAASIVNSGTIGVGAVTTGATPVLTAGGNTAAVLIAGGAVTNMTGGLITSTGGANSSAIVSSGTTTVTNNGAISATAAGILVTATTGTSTITNNGAISTSTLTNNSGFAGIEVRNAATVVNNGAITSIQGVVAYLGGTIDNYGSVTVLGDGNGLTIAGAGTATNRSGGVITATQNTTAYGMQASSATGVLVNNGRIDAGIGLVSLATGATITNTGVVAGQDAGIGALTGALNATNSGTITATTTGALATVTGVRSVRGGTFTNTASGVISGVATGVASAGAALTLTNNGAITGSTAAITLTGAFADSVTLGAASTTNGGIALGDGNDTFLLNLGAVVSGPIAGGPGTDSFTAQGTGTTTIAGAVSGFETLTKNGAGTLALSGTNSGFNTVAINAGALTVSGGDAINDTAAVTVAAAGTLGLLANETVGSLAGAGAVTLGGNTLTLANGGGFSGQVTGNGGLTIAGGTFTYGAGDIVSDTATLSVLGGATLNLNGFSDTVGVFNLNGTLTGGGTITAGTYNVSGGTIGMGVGGGTLNITGDATLTSTTTASPINIYSPATLTTGSAERIGDTSAVNIQAGGTLNLGGAETIGSLANLNGTGGTVQLNANMLTVGGTNADTLFAGSLTGNGGSLTKTGTGTLTLAGGSSYTGGTNVVAGTLVASNRGDAFGSGTTDIAMGATVQFDNQTSGVIYLPTSSFTGAGRLLFTGNAGAVTAFGSPDPNAPVTISLSAGGLIDVQSGTLIGSTNRDGFFTGNQGSLNVAMDASFNGVEGAIVVDALTGAGSIQGGFGGNPPGSFTLGIAGGSGTFTGTVADADPANGGVLHLIKEGAGTQVLAGVGSYSGATDINAGTLVASGGSAIGDTSAVSVASGATFQITADETIGSLAGTGNVLLGGTLSTGGDNTDTTFAGVASGNGGLYKFGAGTLTLSGANSFTGAAVVNDGTLALGAGERLSDAGDLRIGGDGTFDLRDFDETVGTATISGRLASTPNGTGTLRAASYTLDSGGFPFGLSKPVVDGNLGAGVLTVQGKGVSTLNGTAGAATVNITGSTLLLGGDERLNDAAAVTVTSIASPFEGTQHGSLNVGTFVETVGSLQLTGSSLDGAGTLNAATYGLDNATVNANLGAGVLTQQNGLSVLNGTVGAGTVNVAGGTLQLGADDRLADGAAVSVAAGTVLDLQGYNDTVATLALNGTLAGTGTLTATSYTLNAAAVNANLGTGTLTQASGTSTLTGTANAGTVNVAGGTLQLANNDRLADGAAVTVASDAALDLGMFTDTVGSLQLNGSLNGTGTLTATSYTLNGAAVNANLGTGTLTQAGGVSTLTGTAGAGTVNVAGGTLALANNDRLADGAAVSVASGAVLDLGMFSDTVGSLQLNGSLNGAGTLTAASYALNGAAVNANLGAGTLTQAGGVSTLTGTAAATTVAIDAGTLQTAAAERIDDGAAVTIAGGATLALGGAETIGSLAGAGNVTLGANTLTTGGLNASPTFAGVIAGSGGLTKVGAGTLTLSGANSYTGATTIAGGTLAVSGGAAIADAGAVTVGSGATLLLNASETIGSLAGAGNVALGANTLTTGGNAASTTFAGVISGAGGLTKVGPATLTLAGANGYTGATTVAGGTLALGASNVLADATAVAVASGAVLDLGAFSDTVGTLQLNGTLNGAGTLTAASYLLNAATVNANLGAGTLTNAGGASTLNGTSGAGTVNVAAGTLALGAANRLADNAAVTVASGATLNLGAFSDTVGSAAINGSLNGTGTLSAASYTLGAGTVNANLGAGVLTNAGGASTLNGTSGAGTVNVAAGSLRLGADERLLDTGAVGIGSGATLDLNGRTETVASVTGPGTVALGAGRLVLAGAGASSLGALTGTGNVDKTGAGTLTLANAYASTGSINTSAGSTVFTGASAGSLRLTGGALSGTGTAAGALTVTGGTVAPGTAANPFGTLSVGSFAMSGGTYQIEFGGPASGYASDLIRVAGAASLGGAVSIANNGFVPTDRFQQTYTVVQAGSIAGTFSNFGTFTQSSTDPTLFYRLRYDLSPTAVVLQVQRQIDFAAAVPGGSGNQLAVGRALTGTAGMASDAFAATLNAIATSGGDRGATYDSLSGEAIADVTTGALFVSDRFMDLLHARMGVGAGGAGEAQYALRAGSTDGKQHANGFAGALQDGVDAQGGTAASSGGGVWLQGYGAGRRLSGLAGQARTNSFVSGLAGGLDGRFGNVSIGVAGGFSDLDTHVQARRSTVEGTLYQGGAYLAYDNGALYGQVAGDYYGGDVTVTRQLVIGGAGVGQAQGATNVHGYSVSGVLGARFDVGGGTRFGVELTGQETQAVRRAYTETAPLSLGLTAARDRRDVFTGTAQAKLSHLFSGNGWTAEPFAMGGVQVNSGDLATTSGVQFGAAPTGTGGFLVQGAALEHTLGVFTGGIEIKPSGQFRIDLAAGAALGHRTREGQVKVSAHIAF